MRVAESKNDRKTFAPVASYFNVKRCVARTSRALAQNSQRPRRGRLLAKVIDARASAVSQNAGDFAGCVKIRRPAADNELDDVVQIAR